MCGEVFAGGNTSDCQQDFRNMGPTEPNMSPAPKLGWVARYDGTFGAETQPRIPRLSPGLGPTPAAQMFSKKHPVLQHPSIISNSIISNMFISSTQTVEAFKRTLDVRDRASFKKGPIDVPTSPSLQCLGQL